MGGFICSESHRCKSLLSALHLAFRRHRYEDAASKATFPYATAPAWSPSAFTASLVKELSPTKAQSHSAASPARPHLLMFMDPHPSVPFAATQPTKYACPDAMFVNEAFGGVGGVNFNRKLCACGNYRYVTQ